jgi:hypothetical protein
LLPFGKGPQPRQPDSRYPLYVLWLGFLLLVFVLPVLGDELPPHILNLARIQRQMTAELKRLPNYTCLETIERYSAAEGRKVKPYDRIRINVAIVEGKELYSWPGARTFDERSLASMINNGFISDGDFAAMARNIFVNRNANITFVGTEAEGGRKLLRYDFRISQMMSGWRVRVGNSYGTVASAGSFWADAGTLDLVRLSFAARELPPFSQEKRLEESAEYGRVRIGSDEVMLPLAVDLDGESFDGTVHHNHTTFTGCRQYGVETILSFGDDPEGPVVTEGPEPVRALPGGLAITVRLEAPIESSHAAVGDEVRAIVAKDVKFGQEVVLPRGALVKGVIRRLDQHRGNAPYFEVGLEFVEAEFGGHRAVFQGKLEDVSAFPGYHRNAVGFVTSIGPRQSLGVGCFYVEGEAIRIPKGTSFTWLTQPVRVP